jgi:hypothetical protein
VTPNAGSFMDRAHRRRVIANATGLMPPLLSIRLRGRVPLAPDARSLRSVGQALPGQVNRRSNLTAAESIGARVYTVLQFACGCTQEIIFDIDQADIVGL